MTNYPGVSPTLIQVSSPWTDKIKKVVLAKDITQFREWLAQSGYEADEVVYLSQVGDYTCIPTLDPESMVYLPGYDQCVTWPLFWERILNPVLVKARSRKP